MLKERPEEAKSCHKEGKQSPRVADAGHFGYMYDQGSPPEQQVCACFRLCAFVCRDFDNKTKDSGFAESKDDLRGTSLPSRSRPPPMPENSLILHASAPPSLPRPEP